MKRGGFQMLENSRRKPEISRRETEIMRAEAIQEEMASAVRLLGGNGSAKEQNWRASRAAGLSATIIERLRWRKIKRVPADVADTVREALARHNEASARHAEHELFVARQAAAILRSRLAQVDPDFAGSFAGVDRR